MNKVIKSYEKPKKLICALQGSRTFVFEILLSDLDCRTFVLWGRWIIVLLQIGSWFLLMSFMTSLAIREFP